MNNNMNMQNDFNMGEPQRPQYPQTKLCKHCRSQMDVRATVCPSCRKKQSHPFLTVMLILAAAFIGIPFCIGFMKGVTGESRKTTVQPSNSVESESTPVQSRLVYDKDGIRISYTGIEENSSRLQVKFLIENNTDKRYCIQQRDFSVNGYMIDALMSADVAAHKKCNDQIKVYKSNLSDNGIDQIENIEFKFHIFEWDHLSGGFDTDIITLN